MRSFTTITAVVAALAGMTSAQVTYNSTTGTFSCPIANGAYCASSSLEGPIIIRCTNGIGQPGNCDDNLAGFFPFGVNYSPCWETSDQSGDAACSKNCIVQGASGNFNGTFTLPNCTPIPNTTSAVSLSGSTTTTSTGTSTVVVGSTTEVITFTTTYCPTNTTTPVIPPPIAPSTFSTPAVSTPPPITLSIPTPIILPSGIVTILSSGTAVGTGGAGSSSEGGAGAGAGSSGVHNATTGGSESGGSPTATPVGPSKTATGTGAPEYTGAANALNVGGVAAVGAVLAWLL